MGSAVAAAVVCGIAAAAASPPAGRGLDPAKALTQYVIDAWSTDNGLPQNTVNAILQTRQGYVWFGTYDGLARFDGVRFTVFHRGNTDGLKDSGIRALCEDRDGALWIGTNGGGLTRFADGVFSHHSPGQGPANDMVWAVAPDPDGGVWVGTNAGTLYRFRNGAFETVLTSPSKESIYTILRDDQGQVWVGTHGGGLKRRSVDGRWTAYTNRDGLPSNLVRVILDDRAGGLWLGTLGGGLARFEQGRFRSYSLREGLPDDVVSGIVEDRQGTLWLATRRGLVRFRDGAFTTLTAAQGLPDDVLYSLLEDREGALWIGTNVGGALRLRDGTFTTFTTREGLSGDFVYPIYEDGQGSVWVGTSRGLNRLRDGQWTRFTREDGLCHDVVRSLWGRPDGDLWVGTYGGGVCRRHGDRWRQYTKKEGLAHDGVRAVLGTREGSVWVGTVEGLSRLAGGGWKTYTTGDGLPANSVICLAEDAAGGLWVGTDGGGLGRFLEGRFETFAKEHGLPSNVVLTLLPDSDGSLWIGTSGGLSHFVAGRISSYSTREGLPADAIHQILDDGAGNLWVGGSRGIHRLDKRALAQPRPDGATLVTLSLGRSDGMRSMQCTAPAQPAGFKTRDGRLWFGTAKGVAVLDPKRLRVQEEPPPLVIESLAADERTFEPRGPIRLAPGTARVAFRYTGLSLLAPENVRFRYRLAGFDEDWVDSGERRVAFYTGLRPGDYRFEVTGRVGAGAWNPLAASLEVQVEPRLHQTRGFLVSVVLAAAIVVAGAHRVRVAHLEARQRELRLLVEERTRSLQEEKERAEAARGEAERLKGIAEEASALKTELLGIAAHDLRNPLQSVLGLSEILGANPDGNVAASSRIIHKSSRRMVGLIDDLLATASLEGKIDLRVETVDLAGLAGTVVDDWRPRADRKAQALRLAAGSGCLVRVDEDRMREVMENLVSNAVKYSSRGRPIDVAVTTADGTVRFEVKDEGPGFGESDLPRLFGRFQRLSARPTGGESSTGLGLYIVKRLVDLFGGRVWAESEGPGKGSRFVVELPRVDRLVG